MNMRTGMVKKDKTYHSALSRSQAISMGGGGYKEHWQWKSRYADETTAYGGVFHHDFGQFMVLKANATTETYELGWEDSSDNLKVLREIGTSRWHLCRLARPYTRHASQCISMSICVLASLVMYACVCTFVFVLSFEISLVCL